MKVLCLFLLVLIRPLVSFGNTISASIIDQTTAVQVVAVSGYSRCMDSGVFTATCSASAPNHEGDARAAVIINTNPAPYMINAIGDPGCCGDGMASASINDIVVISGGTGAGYLNIAFSADTPLNHSSESLEVNGQDGVRWNGGVGSIGGVFTFQFDQPFDMELGASAFSDNGYSGDLAVELLGARVYTTVPTSCLPGSLCFDPGYTSVPVLGSVLNPPSSGITSADAPEPSTGFLVISLFPVAAVFRRRVRARGLS